VMKAVRVHAFGGVDAMVYEDLPNPAPGPGQVLIRVAAAGVGPWDAWIREGKSVLPQPLPLTLGADLSGSIEQVGPGVVGFRPGEQVFGVTNTRFTGAYAEYALVDAGMIAVKPARLSDTEAASVSVVGCTARQMLFDHAGVREGQTVVVLGGAGNVGGYAVQLGQLAGARIVATASPRGFDLLRSWGVAEIVAAGEPPPSHLAAQADVVIDTVGGAALAEAFAWLRRGGVLVSAVSEPDQDAARRYGVRAHFMLVAVNRAGLSRLADLLDAGKLRARVGETLGLAEARLAHGMLEGGKGRPGKIVLVP
jgi:NADPH:quinone reductase-like Zn-dependent oxidoreductase